MEGLCFQYEAFKKVYFEYDFYTPKPWEYRVRTAEELRRRTLIKKTLKGAVHSLGWTGI